MASLDRGMPHQTDVRRRRRGWIAICTCGWSEEAVSGFAGWSATRRHVCDLQAAASKPRLVPSGSPRVRLLETGPVSERPYDQDGAS